MAADGVPGSKGNPQFIGGGAPSTAPDMNLVSQWAADRIGESVPTPGALPAPSLWTGRLFFVESDKSLRVSNGATWDIIGGGVITQAAPTLGAGWSLGGEFLVARRGKKVTANIHVGRATAIVDGVSPGAVLLTGFLPTKAIGGAGFISVGGAASTAGFLLTTAGVLTIYGPSAPNNTNFQLALEFEGQ